MAVVIEGEVQSGEVSLNGFRYPIDNKVSAQVISSFPEKQVFGDYTQDNDPVVSHWTVSDQRGGIGKEEWQGEKDNNRSWFSTAHTRYAGHMTLPFLATAIALPVTVTAASITNADMELTTGWSVDNRSGTQKHGGSYAWYLANNTSNYQDAVTWEAAWQGKTFTFFCWVYVSIAGGSAKIGLDDGVTTTYSAAVTTLATWTQISVTKTLASNATRLRLILAQTVDAKAAYFDDAEICSPVIGSTSHFANFNGVLYVASGRLLSKLNATGDGWTGVASLPNTITDIVASVNDCLYIFLGDADEYWYMSTAEAFTETTGAAAETMGTYGIHWNDLLFKADSAGQLAYCAAPNSATPDFTNNGKLPLADNDLQSLGTYRDAGGDDIIYAATKNGLWVHDYANAKFLQSEVKMPNHTNAGKGFCVWHSGAYVSSGVGVVRYQTGQSATTITEVGLDNDDGLPSEYSGEIVKLIESYVDFYALVDSSQSTGTGTSFVASRDDDGWQVLWADTSTEGALGSGAISSVYAHRRWFNQGTTIYHLPLQRTRLNPLKDTTTTYATAGFHVTPWFNANWANADKTALKFKVYTAGCTSTETVIVKYRVNHATTALASTWTTMGTITTNGETVYTFGSSAGVAFKSIQFRFDLARGDTTTATPDVQWFSLSYLQNMPNSTSTASWGYQFVIDATGERKEYDPPSLLMSRLRTALNSNVLVAFGYRNDAGGTESYYGRIRAITGAERTGEIKESKYTIFFEVP